MKRLPVDMSELCTAMDAPEKGPTRAFFDVQTGEIEYVPRKYSVEGVFEDIFAAPERWREIPPLTTAERVRLRGQFVDKVGDPYWRSRLNDALDGADPLGAFATVTRQQATLGDQWLQHRDAALITRAHAWLAQLKILAAAAGDSPA